MGAYLKDTINDAPVLVDCRLLKCPMKDNTDTVRLCWDGQLRGGWDSWEHDCEQDRGGSDKRRDIDYERNYDVCRRYAKDYSP